MLDKETMLINKITKKGKIEINIEIKKAINLEQVGLDGSWFELGKQELWLKRNFPKMAKTTISSQKDGI